MNPTGGNDGYDIARLTLARGLAALKPLPHSSIVVVGAIAVYLRAPDPIPGLSPFTLDGDIVVDPRSIRLPRMVRELLESEGFELRNDFGGFYTLREYGRSASQLDVLVPAGFDHLWDLERYTHRDKLAVHRQPGLELCLLDHSPMQFRALHGHRTTEAIRVEVAGPHALLIAKGWKIGERHENGPEAFAEVSKDVGDVYRLLRTSLRDEIPRALTSLRLRRADLEVERTGLEYISKLCANGGPALELLRDVLGTSGEATIHIDSLEQLANRYVALVRSVRG